MTNYDPSLLNKALSKIDEMNFTIQQELFIFFEWPNWDEHLQWLLTASREEITSWGEATNWGQEEK